MESVSLQFLSGIAAFAIGVFTTWFVIHWLNKWWIIRKLKRLYLEFIEWDHTEVSRERVIAFHLLYTKLLCLVDQERKLTRRVNITKDILDVHVKIYHQEFICICGKIVENDLLRARDIREVMTMWRICWYGIVDHFPVNWDSWIQDGLGASLADINRQLNDLYGLYRELASTEVMPPDLEGRLRDIETSLLRFRVSSLVLSPQNEEG